MLIQIEHLKKSYWVEGKELPILKDVIFSVSEGEFVSIMGPSGSGKSTLMSILGCLMPPTSGSFILAGRQMVGVSSLELSRTRNHMIGFVFQDYLLLEGMTAIENVLLPLHYRWDIPRSEQKKRAEEVLQSVGLAHKMHNDPRTLSGGQKQRVAIARALVTQPKILIGDEPCGALDPVSRQDVLFIFQQLVNTGVTILMVTHNEEDARYSKRILTIENGFLVEDKPVQKPQIAVNKGVLPQTATSAEPGAQAIGEEQFHNAIQFLSRNPTAQNLNLAFTLIDQVKNATQIPPMLRALQHFVQHTFLQEALFSFAQKYLCHELWTVRLTAVELLREILPTAPGQLPSRILDYFFQTIQDENDDVRHFSLMALGNWCRNHSLEPLLPLLKKCTEDRDPRVRADVGSICQYFFFKDVEEILFKLMEDQDNRVRANALGSLWFRAKKEGEPMKILADRLVKFLGDTSNRIVADTAVYLHDLYPEMCNVAIEKLLIHDSPLHVASGIFSASKVNKELLKKYFIALMANPNQRVQKALNRLCNLSDQEVAHLLAKTG